MFSYDELPYESRVSRATSPAHLGAVGRLFGLECALPSSARILELGCATGANLLTFAARHPAAHCIGLDLSRTAIDMGQGALADLRLGNVELVQESLADTDAGALGTFDYVIAQGVYSWVPRDIRDRLMDLCRSCLAPGGVALLGYHTLPGWRFSGTVREMLRYATRAHADRRTSIDGARDFMGFLSRATMQDGTFYQGHIDASVRRIAGKGDTDFYHEYLDPVNSPVYFHELAEDAQNHGLQYVWDADLDTGFVDNFPPPIAAEILRRASNLVEAEQLMDFIRNRRWRNSILCRDDDTVSHDLTPTRIRPFRLAADLTRGEASGAHAPVFRDHRGSEIGAGSAATEAALTHLASKWPEDATFDELAIAAGLLPSSTADALAGDLLRLCFLGSAHLYLEPTGATREIAALPRADPYAGWRARHGMDAINLHHMTVALGDAERDMLGRLDGAHRRERLVGGSGPEASEGMNILQNLAKSGFLMN